MRWCWLLGVQALQPERLQGQHSYFPLDIFWPQNRWHLYSQILPFTPVHLDQLLLDILALAAVPPYPWGQLLYHEVLVQSLDAGLPGHFAEFGVGLGGSSIFFGQLAKAYGRRMVAVDSFQGLTPGPRDEPYFAAGDLRAEGDVGELLGEVELLRMDFAEVQLDMPLAFVHIDGDLYQSVLDALEKVWDSVVIGGLVIIDDFFHKVQGPARAVSDFFRNRGLAPTLHVAPAYAVLLVKSAENCVGPRAMDGNHYSFDLMRDFQPFVSMVERSAQRAHGRARENAEEFLGFLRYRGAPSGADIFRYLAPLEDMLDLSDGLGCGPPRQGGRAMRVPRRRLEHRFTSCEPWRLETCNETQLRFIEEMRGRDLEAEVISLAEMLDMSQPTVDPRNAELLDQIAVLKRMAGMGQEGLCVGQEGHGHAHA